MRSHADTIQQQFDPQSEAYLTSAVHAGGPDLQRARELIDTLPPVSVGLDVGCGAGHLAFAMAQRFSRVIASDPSPGMLATVASAARQRGLTGIEMCQAGAESLPFADASFDVVGTRYSAHHWLDLESSLATMRRVLKPGGLLLAIDVVGGETALADTHLQAMELLRDPGHVRNRTVVEWRRLLADAGFRLQEEARYPVRLEFASWIARMRTPPDTAAAIRTLQKGAPRQVADALALEPDGSFTVHAGLFGAVR